MKCLKKYLEGDLIPEIYLEFLLTTRRRLMLRNDNTITTVDMKERTLTLSAKKTELYSLPCCQEI